MMRKQQQQPPIAVVNNDLINRIVNLPEHEFWKLVSARLNMPLSQSEMKERGIAEEEREYWLEECLVDELFLQLAGAKEIIRHNGKCITVHKYYNQARNLMKWIPIAKPVPEFVVNMSDLDLRTIAELKAVSYDDDDDEENKGDPNYILKQAVGQIFENIDSRQYHLSIARNLEVILKP